MSDVNANINIDINSSQAIAGLRNLEAQINRFQRTVTNANAAGVSSLNKGLVDSINATNLFNSRMVDATSSSKRFSDALDKGKLSLGQYVSHAASQMPGMSRVFKREFDTMEQVAKTRVRAINSQYIALGKTVDGVTRAIKSTPTGIADGYGGNLAVTAQRQQMLNKLIDDGSTKLLNWGKNTQWAGRQLMVGFSLPLAALGTVASQTFMEIDKAGLALKRVYGDLSTTTEEINANVDAIKTLGAEYTKYGIALSDTITIAGRAAATGATNEKLLAETEQTLRFATLGQIDYNTALDSTIALQTAFGVSNEDLAKKIDFLNAVENQTILTIEDMALAIPRVATVVKGLGGDVEDLAVMMTAMREGGVSAENAANALKSGLASLINPTKRATESLSSMGINIQKIISNNKGDLMGLIKDFANATNTLDEFSRQQVFEQVFGKYQYARMSALFTNITRDAGQAARAMELAGKSAQDLAAISKKELDAISDTTTVKFQAAMEQLKISIAPLGEAFLKGITPIVELVTKVAEAFNNLPDGVKNSIAVITGLVGGLGPVLLMTIGLVGNGIANLVKAFQFFRKTLSRLKGDASAFQYMATAELEALVATERLEGGAIQLTRSLNLQRNAVDALTTSYTRFAQAAGIAGSAMSTVGGRPVPGGTGGRPLPPPVRRNRGGSIPYFSDGGSSTVPGVGNTDTVPAMLTPGEFVVNKQSTRENLPLLHAINDGQQVQYRNNGGMIPGVQYFNRRMPQRVVRRSPLDPFTAVLGGIRPGGQKRTSSPEKFSYIGSSYETTYRTKAETYLEDKLGEDVWRRIPKNIRENMLMGDTSHKIEREIKGQKVWYEPELFGAFGGENRAIRYIFGEAGKPGIGGKLIQIANDGRLNKSEQMFLTRFLKGVHPTSRSEIKALRKMLRNMEMYIDKNEEDPYVIKYTNSATYKNKWDKVLYHLVGARLQNRFGGTKVIPITKENLKTVSRRNEGGIIPGVQRLMSGSLVRRPNQSRLQVAKTAKGKELDDILYSRNSEGKLDIDAQTLFEIVRRKDLDEKQLSNIKKYFGKRIKKGIFGDIVGNRNGRETRVSDPQLSTWRKIAKVLEDKGHKVFNKGGMIPGVQYKSKGGPLRFHQLSLFEEYLPHTAKYNSEVYRLRSGILRPGAMRINASGYLSMMRSVDRYIPGFDKMPLDEQIAYLSALREGRMPTSASQQDPWGGLAKAEPWVIELLASEEGQSRTLMSMLGRAAGHSLKTTGQLPQASEDLSVHSGRMVKNLAELGIIRDPRTPDSHPNWINQPSDLLDGITIDPSLQRQLSPMEEMQGLEFIRAVLKRGRSQSRARSAELDLSDLIEEFLKQQSFGSKIIGANKGGMIPGVQYFGAPGAAGGRVFRQFREGFDWESAISKTKKDSRLRRLFFPSENEQEYQEIFNTMYDPYLRVTSGTAKPENSDPYSGVIQLIRKGDLSEGEVDFITRFLFHSVTEDLPRVERTPTETRYNARTPGKELRDAFIKRQPGKEKEFAHGRQNVESIIEILSFLKSFPQDHLTAVLIAKRFKDFLGYDDPKLIRAMYALMANKGGFIPGIQKFLNGGEVFGQMLGIGGPTYDSPTSSTPIVPGVGNTDTVPAMLTPGEFVINKQATSENLPLLHAINDGIRMNRGGQIPGVQYFGGNDPGGEVEDKSNDRGKGPERSVRGHTQRPKIAANNDFEIFKELASREKDKYGEETKQAKLWQRATGAQFLTNWVLDIPDLANDSKMTGPEWSEMFNDKEIKKQMVSVLNAEIKKAMKETGSVFDNEEIKTKIKDFTNRYAEGMSKGLATTSDYITDNVLHDVDEKVIQSLKGTIDPDVEKAIEKVRSTYTTARPIILGEKHSRQTISHPIQEEMRRQGIKGFERGPITTYKGQNYPGIGKHGPNYTLTEEQKARVSYSTESRTPPTQSQERQERITVRSGKEILKELRYVSKAMATQMAESKASVITAQEELENFRRLPLSLRGSVGDYEEGIAKRQRDLDEAKKQRQEATRKFNELQKERREQKARDKEEAKQRRFVREPFNQRARELAASRVPESENLTNKQRGRALAREMSAARATIKAEDDAVRKATAKRALEIKRENKGMTDTEAVQRARLERQSSMNMGGQDATAPKVKKPGLLQRMQGGIGAGSMGVSMALGMGSMLPMMKQDEEGKFLGMDSGNAMMGMMGGSMLVGMIPMLGKFAGPAAIALAAIAAVGTGFFLFRKSLDEAATAAAKFGSNVGGTANALGTMSKVIGVADPLQNRKLQQISVLPKDQEQFAQYIQMFQQEEGQKFISNLNKSFGEDKFNKLSDYIRNAVAAGMMTVAEGQLFAKAVGAQTGDNLLGTRVAASIAGQDTGSDALLALARKREAAVEEQGMYKEFENVVNPKPRDGIGIRGIPVSSKDINSANAAFVISAGTEIMKAYNAAVAKAEEEYTKGTISWENLIKTVDEASAATKTWSDNLSKATLASDDLGATTKGVENSLIASGAVTQEQLDAIKGAGGNIALGANAFDIGSADVFSGEGMFAKATSAISPLGIGYGFDWVSEKLGLTKKGLFSGEGGLTSGSYADFYAQNLVQQGQLQEGTKEYDQAIADAKKAQAAVYKMTGANTGVARGTMGAGTDYLQAAKLQYIESQGSTQQAIEQANALEQEILTNPLGDAAQAFEKLGMTADSFSQAMTTANSDILFSSEALSKRFLDISANIKVPGFQEIFRAYVAGGVDEADREKRLNEIGGIGQGLSPTARAEAQSRYLSTKTLAQKYYDTNTVDSLMNTAKSAGLFTNYTLKQGGTRNVAGHSVKEQERVFNAAAALRFEKAIGAAGEAGVTKQVIDYSIRISGEEKKNPSAVLEDLTEKFKDLASLDTQILTALNVKIDENGNPIDGEDVERLGGQSEALSRGWNMLGALNPNINIQMAASAVLLDGEGNAITDPVAVAKNIMALNKAFSQLTKAKTKEAKLSAQIQIATLYLGEKAGTGEGKVDPAKVVEDARKTLAQIGKDLDKLPPATVSQIIQLGTTFQIQNADLIENIANLNSAISKTKDPEELRRLISARNRMVSQLEGAQKDTEAGQLGLAIGGGGGGGGGGGAESALQSFEKGILDQAKMWLDAGATLDQLNKAKGIFAGKIKEGQGIFDKLKNIKGILPRQLEQIIGMGPKGASDFIKKYTKDGKLTKAGKGLLNVEAAYTRESFLEGLRLTPTTASLDKVRTNLEDRKVESDIIEKIMNDETAIEIMQRGSKKQQEDMIQIFRRRRTEEEIIAAKTKEILDANEKTQKLLDGQIKKQEDIVESIQDQIDELEKKNDADQWAIRNKSREKELIDRQIESLERANEMDRRRIETLQRQDEVRNREADALSHELEAMSDLENKIRETYQERIDALDKVTELNNYILEQERQRLGLSQALSEGDIYAATAAAQEMRQTQAGFAQQQLRSGLEQGMENAVSGLRTSEGLTREQAEERIKTIKDQSYQTSLLVRDIEDAIYARNQEMIPLKDQQYQIDLQIRDLSDQIFARETDIYNIRTKQLDPAMKLLESLNDEKTAAQEITDETISQIEATADLYKNTDELAQKVDNIAAGWHEVNKQIVNANKAAANAVLELGDAPTRQRGETDKEFATRVENWQNERNAIRARRDKAVSDALAQGKAATASYASATPASTTTASTENFYGGIRTYGNGGKIKKYAAGNVVGSGSRDSVNAMLTPGEFVVRKAMVGKYGIPMLNAINQGAFSMPKYNVSESTAGNVSVKTQNTSNIISPMYNNYSVNVSVSNTNASADEIANRTISKIKQMQNMQIRSGRGY